jgi:hypothetical protein
VNSVERWVTGRKPKADPPGRDPTTQSSGIDAGELPDAIGDARRVPSSSEMDDQARFYIGVAVITTVAVSRTDDYLAVHTGANALSP